MLDHEHVDYHGVATQISTSSQLHATLLCRSISRKVEFCDKKKQSAIAGFSITACLRQFLSVGLCGHISFASSGHCMSAALWVKKMVVLGCLPLLLAGNAA